MTKIALRGFTLVELMLVVAIMGVLSSIGVANVGPMIRRSQEARTLGNLALLRATIALYFTDNEGHFPVDDLTSLKPKFIVKIPLKMTTSYHPEGNSVTGGAAADMTDSRGDWFYFNDASEPEFGKVIVNCIHRNLKGIVWSTY